MATFLPSRAVIDSSCVEEPSELTPLLEAASTTAPLASQGHCLLVQPLVAVRPGFGGDMTSRLEPWLATCQRYTPTRAPLGGNAGVGLTFRVGEAPNRMYVEARYHFAPTKNVTTELLTVNWGIRY